MVSILPGVDMSRVVVRNPLFSYLFTSMAQQAPNEKVPRGYSMSRARAGAWSQSGQVSAPTFHVGENDPVHEIWVLSMQTLQASLRCSSNWPSYGTDTIGKYIFDMSVEFMVVHRLVV